MSHQDPCTIRIVQDASLQNPSTVHFKTRDLRAACPNSRAETVWEKGCFINKLFIGDDVDQQISALWS